jgi:hypothetical protein
MQTDFQTAERGNIIFMVLIAVILIGALTAAIFSSGQSESSNIDEETLVIKTTQVQSYAGELERGIQYIMQNSGISESDFRFAHADAPDDYGDITDTPEAQLFSSSGGGALYRLPPSGINDGSVWEFYGHTAVPAVGSDAADLIAVLPNVTEAFCTRVNSLAGQSAELDDTGTCLYSGDSERFNAVDQFSSSPNSVDETDFAQDTTISAVKPAPEACVTCSNGSRHYYHVLYAR